MKKLAIIAATALLLASCTKEDVKHAAEIYTYIKADNQPRQPLRCLIRLYDTKNLSKTDFYAGKAIINPHFVLKEKERLPVTLPGTDSVQTIAVYDTIKPFTSMESYATGKEGYVIFNDLPEREYIGIVHNSTRNLSHGIFTITAGTKEEPSSRDITYYDNEIFTEPIFVDFDNIPQ